MYNNLCVDHVTGYEKITKWNRKRSPVCSSWAKYAISFISSSGDVLDEFSKLLFDLPRVEWLDAALDGQTWQRFFRMMSTNGDARQCELAGAAETSISTPMN